MSVISSDEFLTNNAQLENKLVLYFVGSSIAGLVDPAKVARRFYNLFIRNSHVLPGDPISSNIMLVCDGSPYDEEYPSIANVIVEFYKLMVQFEFQPRIYVITDEICAKTYVEENPKVPVTNVVSFVPQKYPETKQPIYSGHIDMKPQGVTKIVSLLDLKYQLLAASGGTAVYQELEYAYYLNNICGFDLSELNSMYTLEQVISMLDKLKINKDRVQSLELARKYFACYVFYCVVYT
jgi:hypothetical protein